MDYRQTSALHGLLILGSFSRSLPSAILRNKYSIAAQTHAIALLLVGHLLPTSSSTSVCLPTVRLIADAVAAPVSRLERGLNHESTLGIPYLLQLLNPSCVQSTVQCGSYPTPSGELQSPEPSTAMLLSMSHPTNIPSHSGPPPLYKPYPATHALSSRPELVTGGQQIRPMDRRGRVDNAQQLPSLRSLLEPELLDKNSSDTLTRLSGDTQSSYGIGLRYESSSPTLKRRHDFDSYARGYLEHNAMMSQTSYLHRQTLATAHNDSKSTSASTPVSAFGDGRLELQRRESFAVAPHLSLATKGFRPPLKSSDSVEALVCHTVQDEFEDADRPVRRRLDGSSRAPVRQSRLVGQRDVPGEGLCYIYEDGTYCRAIIDGEPVNPSWGITKAGKPRKRLAQACLTCREKKIKCEPGFPKCHQCAKSQRVCRG